MGVAWVWERGWGSGSGLGWAKGELGTVLAWGCMVRTAANGEDVGGSGSGRPAVRAAEGDREVAVVFGPEREPDPQPVTISDWRGRVGNGEK